MLFSILSNHPITPTTYRMVLEGDTSAITTPGQFVNIKLDGFYLRRPISVCDCDSGYLTLIYKVVGGGTEYMATLGSGVKLDLLTGLGNGFDTSLSGEHPLLVGGGVGTPPMYLLAKKLIEEGKVPTAILGFGTADEIILADELKALGCRVFITTVDGSVGRQGFVTDALPHVGEYTYTYACGPEPMLKALYDASSTDGEYSFEERMGCGFGACMGCSCETKYGSIRICRDGPVMKKGVIKW